MVVTALAAQQIYAQCHDECVELKFFRQDLKMHSKNLVAKLERELMPIYGVLGSVQGGEAYLNAVEIMEITLQNLATLPVEYWVLISKGIDDIKQQIDEKNKASAEGTSDSEADGMEATDGPWPNNNGGEQQSSEPEVDADGGDREPAHQVQG